MLSIIDKDTTSSIMLESQERYSSTGMTAELRVIFSKMSLGESFIYPAGDKKTKRSMACKIKGTCHHLGVKIKTRTVGDGILVVYEGRK